MLGGPLHTTGPGGRCEAYGEPFPCSAAEVIYDQVVRRQLDPNPRCRVCTLPDMRGGWPMFTRSIAGDRVRSSYWRRALRLHGGRRALTPPEG